LAIVHALIEAHHGRIDVESRMGRGTSFVITLPRGPIPDSTTPVGSAALADSSTTPSRLLTAIEEETYE
jgi:hypothetical protein